MLSKFNMYLSEKEEEPDWDYNYYRDNLPRKEDLKAAHKRVNRVH